MMKKSTTVGIPEEALHMLSVSPDIKPKGPSNRYGNEKRTVALNNETVATNDLKCKRG